MLYQLNKIINKAGTAHENQLAMQCRDKATQLKVSTPTKLQEAIRHVRDAAAFAEQGAWQKCKDELDGIQ